MNASRGALVRQHGLPAGRLAEVPGGGWTFTYAPGYAGPPVSLIIPLRAEPYHFATFPPFLEGLLPEGPQLEAILRLHKIDRGDCFRQLITVGQDLVGSLTIEQNPEAKEEER
ncbi:MAG: toxin HipA [Verrucomicrobia bacterium]|nr:MAG: toxin HipA [Verrucomicrobiota bacterium]TAE86848.1 MAG: toxin HipA [Verrucomicrobiota bacterium]TAF24621.1 MAG: toxin HipA [Verrucomicrobiota bacterium]TAF40521.1 MAG: toxin HipA [Verrucomicrobiota bacterium]